MTDYAQPTRTPRPFWRRRMATPVQSSPTSDRRLYTLIVVLIGTILLALAVRMS